MNWDSFESGALIGTLAVLCALALYMIGTLIVLMPLFGVAMAVPLVGGLIAAFVTRKRK